MLIAGASLTAFVEFLKLAERLPAYVRARVVVGEPLLCLQDEGVVRVFCQCLRSFRADAIAFIVVGCAEERLDENGEIRRPIEELPHVGSNAFLSLIHI